VVILVFKQFDALAPPGAGALFFHAQLSTTLYDSRVRRLSLRGPHLWLVALSVVLVVGCGRNDAREWAAADHDQPPDRPSPAANTPRAAQPAGSSASANTNANVVEAAWKQQCSKCHGPSGKGDGPEGPMVKAFDLTSASWQASVTDAQIAATIAQGRGKMPAFSLPPALVAALVGRIRAHKAR
jgi:cytochrome c oxidase cbb3-type subunit 3